MAGPVDFARSSHSTRALVDRRVTDASNPKDLQAGLTVEQVQFVKAYVVDALLGTVAALGREKSSVLHMRQRTIAAAMAYFWRFYLKHSFCDHEPTAIAVVCLSLASKVQENPVNDHRKLLHLAKELSKCVYDDAVALADDQLLRMELLVLEELGFNLSVFDPYTPLQQFLQHAADADKDVLRLAWGLLNDCLCTPVCIMLPPEEIAFAAIRVAVELSDKIKEPPVLRSTSFDINHDEVMLACQELLECYRFPSSEAQGPVGSVRIRFLQQHRSEVREFLYYACKGNEETTS